jgi:hypothetical protein
MSRPRVVCKCSILLQSKKCLSTLIVYKTVLSTYFVSNNKLGRATLTMQQPRFSPRLFWLATVALLMGMFWFPLLFAAIPLYLVLLIFQLREPQHREGACFWGAAVFSVVAVVGFFALYYSWGRLDYGLAGYVILFGPFTAVSAAVAFAACYQRLRGHRQQ